MTNLTLSSLAKTWLIDIDGTIVKHNGHLNGEDELLDGVIDFFSKITIEDKIIFLTARDKIHEAPLKKFLQNNNIRYDQIIFNLPYGERILINDKKPSGLQTAYAINGARDAALQLDFIIDKKL